MKCDKLRIENACVYGPDAKVYLAEQVDEAIAELEARIADLEKLNHDLCERVTENDDIRLHWEEIEQTRAENERLKAKLESVQASMYCDVVDANMENRRLKRALWLARAERAEAEHAHWATIWFCNTKIVLNINKSSVSQDPYKSNTFRNASEWRNMWYDIASKCRAKAESYL